MNLNSNPPYSPSWRWSADLAYKFRFDNGASITPRLYADFTGSYYALTENRPTNFIPNRTMLNANIAFNSADGAWELVAGVTNIADKHYYFSAYDNTPTKVTKGVGRPREFLVTLKRNF